MRGNDYLTPYLRLLRAIFLRQTTDEVTEVQRPRLVKPELPIQRLRDLKSRKDRKVGP